MTSSQPGAIGYARESAGATGTPAAPLLPELMELSPSAFVDHIEQTHHAYLRGQLPRLRDLAERVLAADGDRHPELADVCDTFAALRTELEPHLDREQHIVFPFLREIDRAVRCGGQANGELQNPLTVLRDDHEHVGALLARLRDLTNVFTPATDGDASYRAFYDGLRDLADDIELQVHKEDDILFPVAFEQERELRRRPPT